MDIEQFEELLERFRKVPCDWVPERKIVQEKLLTVYRTLQSSVEKLKKERDEALKRLEKWEEAEKDMMAHLPDDLPTNRNN